MGFRVLGFRVRVSYACATGLKSEYAGGGAPLGGSQGRQEAASCKEPDCLARVYNDNRDYSLGYLSSSYIYLTKLKETNISVHLFYSGVNRVFGVHGVLY